MKDRFLKTMKILFLWLEKKVFRAAPCGYLDNQRGVALVITLLVVTLLVTLILDLDSAVRRDLKVVGNLRDDFKAVYIAKSGVAAARAILKDDAQKDSKTKDSYDGLNETWATPFPPYPLGDGIIAAGITDESGKFNVNTLVRTTGGKDEEKTKMLLRLLDLLHVDPTAGEEIVDSIVDWIDPNTDEVSFYGAEEAYYSNLDRPYEPKNGYLNHLSELHQIKGMTDEIFNRISPYLTVYPVPARDTQAGDFKININTADTLILQSFSDEITPELAERIIEDRPFQNPDAIGKVTGISENLASRLKDVFGFKSDFFSIRSEGIVNETQKTVFAVVKRVGTRSTLYSWRIE